MRTHEVARTVGVSPATLLRWLRQGRVPEPKKDRLGWREFSEKDVIRLRALFEKLHPAGRTLQ